MEPRAIFFIGKPGCGKGDQTKLLAEKTGWKLVSSGDLFRATAAESTPLGNKVKAEMDAGLLMPYWFASYLFLRSVFPLAADEDVIFDGFSRKVPEAELAFEALAWLNRPFIALHLKVSDEEIIRRLALRKGTEHRADDAAVEKRFTEFRTYTEPVIEMFRARGVLIEVNGEGDRAAIAADIRAKLGIG